MSALNKALMPPAPARAAPAVVEVDHKKVAASVEDLTKIALELHLKQLEAKQQAQHPEQQQQNAQQQQQQQHFSISSPGEHLPRAVAAIAKGSPLPVPVFVFERLCVCQCVSVCVCVHLIAPFDPTSHRQHHRCRY